MRLTTTFVPMVFAGVAVGCNGSAGDSSAAATSAKPADQSAALMQTSRDWAKAAATGNLDSIVSYWADDAIVLEPDQPAHVGKAAIRKMVEGSLKVPKFSITWEPERASISESGDVGYLIEHNRFTFADSTGKVHTQFGKAVTIWRKDTNGNWKCVVDTWNASPRERVLSAGA